MHKMMFLIALRREAINGLLMIATVLVGAAIVAAVMT